MCDIDIKIYFDNRVVVLTDKSIKNLAINDNPFHVFDNKKTLIALLDRFEQSKDEILYIVHHDLYELFSHVKKCFKYVEAAGGLVILPDGRILMIKRFGKWDLPKGKSQKGESAPETAIREVVEECGLEKTPEIIGELTHTYHTYRQDGKHFLKHTVWYAMLYDGKETDLQPQLDEHITKAIWFPQNLLNVVMLNTYQSIKQVLTSIKK